MNVEREPQQSPGSTVLETTRFDRRRLGRLAIVISHPTQYYSPWFRWISANTALTIRVFYLWEFGIRPTLDLQFQATFKWDVDLLSGYEHEFVPNTATDPGTHHTGGLRNPALGEQLAKWRPSAVLLFGYKSASQLRTILWARLRGVPLIFRGDSHLLGRQKPSLGGRIGLRLLYAQFHAITFVGAANREYFRAVGVPEKRLHFAPHAVNDQLFDPKSEATRGAAATLRQQLRLTPSTRLVLFAGKLVPAKQPRELLTAFLELDLPDTALLFVGDGAEKASLVALSSKVGRTTVHFLPFSNQTEMPARYGAADIFVLPSRGHYETWGLAVNEAMHMGLPCIVSDRVGCQRDLVTNGKTGWVFVAEDFAGLKHSLSEALRSDLSAMKADIAERINRYTYPHAADGLVAAFNAVVR